MTNSDRLVDWLQRATADECEREAADTILSLKSEIEALRDAGRALIADVRRRYPGEELRCEYMRALDAALSGSPEG